MSWIRKLYDTYEFVHQHNLADEDLALPFHLTKSVHIKIVLNQDGKFLNAEKLDNKKEFVIQADEQSSKRAGSTVAPYGLHDTLKYLDKNSANYLTEEYMVTIAQSKQNKKGGQKWAVFLTDTNENQQKFIEKEKKVYQKSFESYQRQLSEWYEFSQLTELHAVLNYIQQGQIIRDLIKTNIFTFEDNILKSGSDEPFSLTVVWSVEIPNDPHIDLWNKSNIQSSWIEFQESKLTQSTNPKKDLCYITGEWVPPAEAYPKILGNAKLVSANDTDGFTFRGRFRGDKDNKAKSELASQAVSLGKNVSQNAFNTLKWLIKRQGFNNNGQIIIAWTINQQTIPQPMQISDDFDDDNPSFEWLEANQQRNLAPENSKSTPDWSQNLGFDAVEKIKKRMNGYLEKLDNHTQISLLALDSATDGRMAITYYQEFLPKDYFVNIDSWIDDFAWYQFKTLNKWKIMPPSPYAIFETIYGKSADKEGKIKKQLYARLLPVISGGKSVPIPYNLVQQSFQVACNPFARHNPKNGENIRKLNWQRNISVACALYRGYFARHHNPLQRRIFSMSLDTQNRSRDYLYGRLLAQAESLEWYALYLQNGKKTPTRVTNAERYFQQFAQHPCSTWLHIESMKLVPYKNYLTSLGKDFYKQAIGEIMDLFENADFVCDNPLNGEFLLGYHCQKMEIDRQIAERKATNAKQKKTETAE